MSFLPWSPKSPRVEARLYTTLLFVTVGVVVNLIGHWGSLRIEYNIAGMVISLTPVVFLIVYDTVFRLVVWSHPVLGVENSASLKEPIIGPSITGIMAEERMQDPTHSVP